jgi:hypothetical protein
VGNHICGRPEKECRVEGGKFGFSILEFFRLLYLRKRQPETVLNLRNDSAGLDSGE